MSVKPFCIKTGLAAAVSLILLFCSSCTTELQIAALSDGSTGVAVKTGFSGSAAETLRTIIGNTAEKDTPLFTADDVTKALESIGFKQVTAAAPDSENVSASGISPAGVTNSFSQSGLFTGNKNSCAITLGPDQLQNVYSSLDEQTQSYLDLLMAPVFTGEKMTVSEYRELLASVYGPTFADEIVNGSLTVSISAPDKIKKITNTITFGELLTLSTQKTWSVSW